MKLLDSEKAALAYLALLAALIVLALVLPANRGPQ